MHFRISLFVVVGAVLLQVSSAKMRNVRVQNANDEVERIIGGRPAKPGQFPWVTALHYNNEFVCTSSIISPRTILTAAHCVVFNGVTQPPDLFYAIANVRRSADGYPIYFESITPHPDYADDSKGIRNDLAVLTTTEPIPFSKTISPVCIAGPKTDMMAYKKATAMGWGDITRSNRKEKIPDQLQYVCQKIVPNKKCRLYYLPLNIEDSKICAGFLNGICNGDSGGPLVHLKPRQKPVEIGVASFINSFIGCGRKAPGVWTRLSSFNDFILGNAADKDDICVI